MLEKIKEIHADKDNLLVFFGAWCVGLLLWGAGFVVHELFTTFNTFWLLLYLVGGVSLWIGAPYIASLLGYCLSTGLYKSFDLIEHFNKWRTK